MPALNVASPKDRATGTLQSVSVKPDEERDDWYTYTMKFRCIVADTYDADKLALTFCGFNEKFEELQLSKRAFKCSQSFPGDGLELSIEPMAFDTSLGDLKARCKDIAIAATKGRVSVTYTFVTEGGAGLASGLVSLLKQTFEMETSREVD